MNDRVNRFAVIVALVTGIAIGLMIGHAIWDSESHLGTSTARGAATQPVGTAEQSAPPAIQLVSGDENGGYERIYGCADGYTAVDVSMGRVSVSNGAHIQVNEDRTSYGYQRSVTASVTLDRGSVLGGVIIVSAANVAGPTIYPQYKLDMPVDEYGTASMTLQSTQYSPNYTDKGIDHLRFCIR